MADVMHHIEVEFAAGLRDIVCEELLTTLGHQNIQNLHLADGEGHFHCDIEITELHRLRTVTAIYLRCEFRVPRPKALLGHENFHRIVDNINFVLNKESNERFSTLYLSAAGSQTSVMRRIKRELAYATNLQPNDETGDLLVRIKREQQLWVVLIRISSRPTATREWRVCDMEGALNGPVAAVMVHMTQPTSSDRVVNLMCGSGTLVIERALHGQAQTIIGVDQSEFALRCAQRNIDAAKVTEEADLILGDAGHTSLPNRYADVILADLPFGQLVGSHTRNLALYPAVLHEAARIASLQARFVLITHEVRLMERLLRSETEWKTIEIYPVELRGLHPRIFVLRKS
jgi:tRNA (guanine6-N2)-methyltransferase